MAEPDFGKIIEEQTRPSVLFRPVLSRGNNFPVWYASYGDNRGDSQAVWATGDSPEEAMRAFDVEWRRKRGY